MATLNISERRKKGFEFFTALENDLRSKLIEELDDIPVGLSPEKIPEKLSEKLPTKTPL